MWINKSWNRDAEYLFVNEKQTNTVMECAAKWQAKNPQGTVNVWYDDSYSTEKTKERALEQLRMLKEKDPKLQSMNIVPLSKIPFIKENPDLFSHQMPLYFRIDLLKLMICTHEASQSTNHSAIFTDISSIKPAKKERLFNSTDLKTLDKHGVLTNALENQFIQVKGDKRTLAVLKHVININALRAITLLKSNRTDINREMPTLYNSVFFSTIEDINFLRSITESSIRFKVKNRLRGEDSDEWVDYDYNTDGYSCFGNYYINAYQKAYIRNANSEKPQPPKVMSTRVDTQTGQFLSNEIEYTPAHSQIKVNRKGGSHRDAVSEFFEPADRNSGYKCKYWEEITPDPESFLPNLINSEN